MMKSGIIGAALVALSWLSSAAPALAQGSGDSALAAGEAPPIWSTEAFASKPLFRAAQISPDGEKFVIRLERDDVEMISIFDAKSRKSLRSFNLPEGQDVTWYRWAGPDRLLLGVFAQVKAGRSFTIPVTRLLVHDFPSNRSYYVGPDKQGLFGDDVIYTDPAGEFILLSFKKNWDSDAEVHRILLDGSEFDETATRVQKTKGDSDTWYADDAGVVRLGVHWRRKSNRIWYRRGPDDDFEKVATVDDYSEEAKYWDVIRISAGSDIGLVLAKGDNDRIAVREFNFYTGELGKVVFEQPGHDVDRVIFAPDRAMRAAYFTDDRDRIHWFEEDMAGWQKMLEEALGTPEVFFTSVARDKSRMMVWAGGENDPGAMYVFTPETLSLDLFSDIRPQINPTLMATPKPVTYTARDGLEIRAYLTLPRGLEAKGLPLIVMPHGGPYGVRDQLNYDDEVQLLANRGYAVLQPNYRGSGGYGDAFEEAGYGQVGRAMQDDIDDAMDWAVQQGIADPARVCVVGASYGGFAAMWSVMRNPERYACAASWAGVTDWGGIMKYDKRYLGRTPSKRLKAKLEGIDQEGSVKDFSPRDHVENLTRPLLVAHGKKDGRVPYRQYTDMERAAKKNPLVEFLLLEESGHGFANEKDEQAWYDALVAFLARHNPSARNPAPEGAGSAP